MFAATIGGLLTKPIEEGCLDFGAIASSIFLAILIIYTIDQASTFLIIQIELPMNLTKLLSGYSLNVLTASLILIQCIAMPAVAKPLLSEYEVVDRVTIGGIGGWDFIAFDPIRQHLFISRGDRVQVWSVQSRKVVSEIAGTAGVHGIALAQDLGLGFTSNGRANTVTVFSLKDLNVVGTINVPGENPDAILYEPKFKRVYSFNGRSNNVTVIDALNFKVLANIALGGKPEVAVSDGAGHVFVNIEDTAEVVVINQAENKIQTRWSLTPCVEPTGLAIDTAHQRLFSVCSNNKMAIVDAQTGRHVAIMPIGGKPDGAEYDSSLGMAFSANGDGTLTLVHENDPEHFTVAANVATQEKARTLALDPVSHRIYLVTASFGPTLAATTEQSEPRSVMLQNSFTVIVTSPK
jgi:YVTN family beta-propeller protein